MFLLIENPNVTTADFVRMTRFRNPGKALAAFVKATHVLEGSTKPYVALWQAPPSKVAAQANWTLMAQWNFGERLPTGKAFT